MRASAKKEFLSSPLLCEVMPENRFFVSSLPEIHSEIALEGDEFRHFLVMRNEIGSKVELIDGKGHLALGKVVKTFKQKALIAIENIKKPLEEQFELILAQALPKNNRLDFILEKGTELGMTSLWLFPGDESEKKEISQHQKERMEHILIASLKQCGRLHKPKISFLPPLIKWDSPPFLTYFGDINKEAPLFYKVWKRESPGAIFINGPEKGFSEREIDRLKKGGAQGVSLGPHILRTDTAALAALVLMGAF